MQILCMARYIQRGSEDLPFTKTIKNVLERGTPSIEMLSCGTPMKAGGNG